MSVIRMRRWTLPVAGAVIVAGIVACVAKQPASPAPVTTAPQQAPVPAVATNTQKEHDHAAEAAVPRMTASELQTAMGKGEVVVVDVRDVRSYSAGHIRGALHIPLASLQAQVASLPKDKTVVAYCT